MENATTPYRFFVGIDLSKTYFDASIVGTDGKRLAHKRLENTPESFPALLDWVASTTRSETAPLFCLEHTGAYGRRLCHFLQDRRQLLWIESPLQIKRSLGILRGKNDRIDSLRIARYAQLRQHQVRLSPHYDAALEQLHDLLTTRNRLLGAHSALSKAQGELAWADEESHRTVVGVQQAAIEGLNASVRQAEQAIDALLDGNPAWRKNFDLATSIHGVGRVTVLWLMVHTRNFDPHFNARKVAALVGIAPYESRSGTSVNAGTHVSKFGHLDVKALLHMVAMASIRCNGQVKRYYKRKKEEGKPGLLVLNNIKNKIVHQIFAVVRSQVPYDPAFVHQRAAA